MVSRPYINKRGRLILRKGQKKLIKKQKGEGFGALLIPLARAALTECFQLGKKKDKKEILYQTVELFLRAIKE